MIEMNSVARTPSLRTPSNMYVINLAVSDLTFSLVNGFPLMTVACFNKGWIWGDTGRVYVGSDRIKLMFAVVLALPRTAMLVLGFGLNITR